MALDIRQQFVYEHPAKDVWEFLTRPDLLAQWLMPTDFIPLVGHKFTFTTRPLPQLASDGICYCEVLELLPLKKLTYSWKTGPGDGSISLDTIVTWTLTETEKGTELDLVHTGFNEETNLEIYAGMTSGWKGNLEKIRTKLNAQKDAASNS